MKLALELARNSKNEKFAKVSQQFQNSMLVQIAKSPQHNEQTLLAETKAFLFAGHDTTAHTMSFAVGELGLNPHVFQTAQTVVDQVWEREDGLSASALKDLSYVEAVVKETMRLHPVGTSIPLVVVEDTELNGIRIPKNTGVNTFFFGAGRDPDMYPQPDTFCPERWLKNGRTEEKEEKQPLLLGFSLGPHYCLGAPLALLEATVMLSLMLRFFNWEVINGVTSLEQLDQNLTIFPKDRMPVRFTNRVMKNNIVVG